MNQILYAAGLEGLKPLVTQLLLPPTVWLWLLLPAAAWLLWRRRRAGWLLVALFALLSWFGATPVAEEQLVRLLTQPPPELTPERQRALAGQPATAIVVLGGGRLADARDWGGPTLRPLSVERLRYGVWLSRRTGLPLLFAGGVGHGARAGASEAELARRIAAEEFRHPLRWTEERSRDTRENAAHSLQILQRERIGRIVLVTHEPHMRRSVRAFAEAAAAGGWALEIVPAPMGTGNRRSAPRDLGDFVPQGDAALGVRYAVREWLGWWAGA